MHFASSSTTLTPMSISGLSSKSISWPKSSSGWEFIKFLECKFEKHKRWSDNMSLLYPASPHPCNLQFILPMSKRKKSSTTTVQHWWVFVLPILDGWKLSYNKMMVWTPTIISRDRNYWFIRTIAWFQMSQIPTQDFCLFP